MKFPSEGFIAGKSHISSESTMPNSPFERMPSATRSSLRGGPKPVTPPLAGKGAGGGGGTARANAPFHGG
jgi:hypothetical protein